MIGHVLAPLFGRSLEMPPNTSSTFTMPKGAKNSRRIVVSLTKRHIGMSAEKREAHLTKLLDTAFNVSCLSMKRDGTEAEGFQALRSATPEEPVVVATCVSKFCGYRGCPSSKEFEDLDLDAHIAKKALSITQATDSEDVRALLPWTSFETYEALQERLKEKSPLRLGHPCVFVCFKGRPGEYN